jgi:hypothetical protein
MSWTSERRKGGDNNMLTDARIQQMICVAGDALASPLGAASLSAEYGAELQGLLAARNGFFTFESALHVFPHGPSSGSLMTLESWNSPIVWKAAYEGMADQLLCFAEDIFGNQFVISEAGIVRFDLETGDADVVAGDIGEWVDLILSDYQKWTGYKLAHEWQVRHGGLDAGQRLAPKIPFVLGGQFDVSNLFAVNATEGVLLRANLAVQIRDLPDGAQVEYIVTD